jgi:CheY-like chemotaxis protein
MMRAQGVRVAEASGGLDAIAQSQQTPFDLILMDISMPDVDGIEALARIRASDGPNANTRIVALTAHAAPEDKERILAGGFETVQTKPLTKRAITRLIDPAPASTEEETSGPQEVIAVLGQDRYGAALAEFHADLRAFAKVLKAAQSPNTALHQHAHMLCGSAAVLGLADKWSALRNLEAAQDKDWHAARDDLLDHVEAALLS